MKYRNKVTEIAAIFYDGSNKTEIEQFLNTHCAEYEDAWRFICWWDKGLSMRAHYGDYVIKLSNGKVFTLWNEIFNELFEPVKDENK